MAASTSSTPEWVDVTPESDDNLERYNEQSDARKEVLKDAANRLDITLLPVQLWPSFTAITIP
jgi:hypothetical protein